MAETYTTTSRIGIGAALRFDNSIIERLGLSTPSKNVIFLGVCLAVLQVLDGILTAIGVMHFGTTAEGNLLIKSAMDYIGCIPALFLIKSIAISVIVCLCYLSHVVSWLETAMKGIIAIYIGAAIVPWSYMLLTKLVI